MVRRLRRLHHPEEHRAARELLFAVALLLTRHPRARRRSLDQIVREWLSLGRRPGAREAWEKLMGHPDFWEELDDEHRRLVARRLRRCSRHPGDIRREVQMLLSSPRFRRADDTFRRAALLTPRTAPQC